MIDEPLIVADFSAVPDRIPLLPAGIYDFQVDTVDKKLAKTPEDGSPPSQGYNISLSVHVVGPSTSPHLNRKMFHNLWISQKPEDLAKPLNERLDLMRVKQFDKACGGNPTANINVNSWMGKVFKGSVKADVYRGQETSKIDRVFIPGDAELKST